MTSLRHLWPSVIIPTLNEESSIIGAIRSAQQCPGVEIIVTNGGSTDATLQLARDHGAQMIQCEPGRGRQLADGAEISDVLVTMVPNTVPEGRPTVALVGMCWQDGGDGPVVRPRRKSRLERKRKRF